MPKTKTTPGPWRAEYSTLDSPGWRVSSDERQVPPYDAYPALRVNLAYSADETEEANARLIAAAPELYAALKAMEHTAMCLGLSRGEDDPDDERLAAALLAHFEAIEQARAALAKAEGRDV